MRRIAVVMVVFLTATGRAAMAGTDVRWAGEAGFVPGESKELADFSGAEIFLELTGLLEKDQEPTAEQ